ncbi:MAG: UbiX family flavin prenyltransferase [Elusimicrobia bacterium]|nr:UbiX family flavin prenyltransferase [Elusimicrobiota bacterium]
MRTFIAITGASGSIYAVHFIKNCPGEKYLALSRWGKSVLAQETGLTIEDLAAPVKKVFSDDELSSPFASGSNPCDAMVILPCSASTLSKIACGIADSLITRAAAVTLKEKRKLVLCLRETPLSMILIENMLRLSQSGAVIMPIVPSFYQGAKTVEEQAQLFSERVCQILDPQFSTQGWRRDAL